MEKREFDMIKLSIIIPSYFRAQLLQWGLDSLSKQQVPVEYEIIVLNDGIPDETERICNQYSNRLNIKYIFTGSRNLTGLKWRVPGYAINIGIKQSKSDIIIIGSPEIILIEKDTIKQLIEPLIDGSKLLSITYGKNDVYEKMLEVYKEKKEIDMATYNSLKFLLPTWLPFFMGMRKDVFLSIGGYDEEFKGYAVDDVELIQRLRMNGCTYYQTQTHIVHLYHSKYMDVRAGFKDIKEQEKQHQFNKDLYETKKDIIIRNRKNSWGELI